MVITIGVTYWDEDICARWEIFDYFGTSVTAVSAETHRPLVQNADSERFDTS